MKKRPYSALHIGNFKAFGETQTIPIKPITLIFGPNSAGKSSIIQSLIFAHEAATQYRGKQSPLDVHTTVLGGDSIDLGGFDNFIHRSSSAAPTAAPPTSDQVEWGLDFPITGSLQTVFPASRSISLRIKFGRISKSLIEQVDEEGLSGEIEIPHRILTVSSVQIRVDGVDFCRFDVDCEPDPTFMGNTTLELTSLQLENPAVSALLDNAIGLASARYSNEFDRAMEKMALPESNSTARTRRQLARQGLNTISLALGSSNHSLLDFYVFSSIPYKANDSSAAEEPPRKQSRKVDELSAELTDCIKNVLASTRRILSRVHYLGPLRQVPERLLILPKEAESFSNADGMQSYKELLHRPELVEQVSAWLEKLEFGYTLERETLIRSSRLKEIPSKDAIRPVGTDDIPHLFLRDRRTGIEVSMKDIGAGVAQALPVISSLVSAHRSVVAIEQPELHLHPRLQAELGDLFIESAIAKRNTIIAETHSEHLILRILRRIRETTNDELPEGMKSLCPDDVCVMYVQPGEGGSTAMQLEITPGGDFVQRWPDGFFSERLEELF